MQVTSAYHLWFWCVVSTFQLRIFHKVLNIFNSLNRIYEPYFIFLFTFFWFRLFWQLQSLREAEELVDDENREKTRLGTAVEDGLQKLKKLKVRRIFPTIPCNCLHRISISWFSIFLQITPFSEHRCIVTILIKAMCRMNPWSTLGYEALPFRVRNSPRKWKTISDLLQKKTK